MHDGYQQFVLNKELSAHARDLPVVPNAGHAVQIWRTRQASSSAPVVGRRTCQFHDWGFEGPKSRQIGSLTLRR